MTTEGERLAEKVRRKIAERKTPEEVARELSVSKARIERIIALAARSDNRRSDDSLRG